MTADADDTTDRMIKISKLIADMQEIQRKFGDTCVYIRRGGVSWGAVALNRQADDEKHGVFDLQAQHDRDMLARLEQIERLKKDRDEWREKAAAFDTAEHECWSIKCESYPTGGDDAEVGWEVISHWQAEPHERVEGRGSTPLKALNDAINQGEAKRRAAAR